jgi:hypothetical protein
MLKRSFFAASGVIAALGMFLMGCGDDGSGNGNENNNNNTTDQVTLTLLQPADAALVSGTVTVEVEMDGEAEEASLEIDGAVVDTVTSPSATVAFEWDTTQGDDGAHEVVVVAASQGAVLDETDPVSVDVDNTPPELAVSGIERPYVYQGVEEIEITVDDANPGDEVVFFVDGVEEARSDAAPHTLTFDPTGRQDGPVEITAETTDAAGNLATEIIEGVVVLEGQLVAFDDGDGTGQFYVPEDYVPGMEVHHKYHWTMPENVTSIMAVAQWDYPDWQFEVATGTGTCPHSGTLYGDTESHGFQAVYVHDATDLGMESYPLETHFIHLGEGSDMDLTQRLGEGSNYWLVVAIY